ncbi:glycerophosphodiester phosphodiesterase family protein [Cryobacterium sp. RTS3]|uniref:glycerophosphodiester phosphodiesterase family protein n=1 Tax=Cryobacterium sp. RTS3 TaxID=3048643 RepID=UPI002B22933A|nr:glycerophosphodiester phosphodiesterase family protein [Cryobacterium sp. RTS3]MEA9997623.1 glycerophosphodiester phosphodiesterase family protein [Cryobacterium sp. RTS3]
MISGGPSTFLAGSPPRIFAHRGLALNAPENTVLAFSHALASGATHLETDVHVSRDGVAVLSHDARLALPELDIQLEALRIAELQRIDLGFGQSFASLAEALDAFPEARFNLDVKSEDAIAATATAVRAAGATDRVLVTSFSEDRRRRTVRLLPGVASSASASVVAQAVVAARVGNRALIRRVLSGCVAVQVPETASVLHVVTPHFVRAVHSVGVEVHVWTVNEPAAMDRLLDTGVEGLITDRSDDAAALISDRSQR